MSFFFFEESKKERDSKREKTLSVETIRSLGCDACPLNDRATLLNHPHMEPTGSKKPLIYILGEAPSQSEDEKGEQFVGESGRIVRNLIPERWEKKIRWNNTVRTRPPKNRTPTNTEIEACRPSIVKDIEKTRPKVIFGFGGIPLYWATGDIGIFKWRGRLLPIQVGSHVCWFFPMLHPSFLLRQRKTNKKTGKIIRSDSEKIFEMDLKRAFKLLKKLPPPEVVSPYKSKYLTPGSRLNVSPEKLFKGVDIITGKNGQEDVQRVRDWLDELMDEPSIGHDIETASDEKMKQRQTRPYGTNSRILSVAVGTYKKSVSFTLYHRESRWTEDQRKEVEKLWVRFLKKYKGVKVAHNLSYELEWYAYFYGKQIVYAGSWGDSMAQAYVIDQRGGMLGLDDLILLHFGFPLKDLMNLDLSRLDYTRLETVLVYNGLDARWTHWLYLRQNKILKRENLTSVYVNRVPAVQSTVLTQFFGNCIDFEKVEHFDETYKKKQKRIEKEISKIKSVLRFKERFRREFNPGSPNDCVILFRDIENRKEGWREKQGKRTFSSDDDALIAIGTPLAKLIQDFRAVTGNHAKYVEPLKPEQKKFVFPDNRVHPNIHTLFTDTGRTSSSFPNEQFWPKRDEAYRDLRSEWNAERGCIMVPIDQGQIQARIIQMAAKDKRYGQYLWDRHDVHMDWTVKLAYAYPKRIGGKKFLKDKEVMKWFRNDIKNQWTFPLFFGASPNSVANYLKMPTEVIYKMVDQFWDEFSGVKEWQEGLVRFYNQNGYVETLCGQRRYGPIGYNEIINTPIQGTEAEIVLDCYNRLSRAAYDLDMWQFQPRLEIHDELVFQLPKKTFDRDLEFIVDHLVECRQFPWINVPLCVEASAGPNWFEAKEIMKVFSDDCGKLSREECGY